MGFLFLKLKTKIFFWAYFFFGSLSWALKNKGVRFMVKGANLYCRGFKIIFFKIFYIYWVRGFI